MRKVQLGCGSNSLGGWENYDREVDLLKPLPFESKSIDRVFCEHTIEHFTQQQGIALLREIKRVLTPGGGARVSFPTPPRGAFSQAYRKFCADQLGVDRKKFLDDDPTGRRCLQVMFFHWGHQAIWTREVMCNVMLAVGFARVTEPFYGESSNVEFRSVDSRHLHVGREIAEEETGIVEGWLQ